MPDWTAPFHMPRFNQEEYLKAKAKYVAKKGYTITVPALSDIFHFGKTKPMSEDERKDWRKKDWDKFSYERMEELEIDMRHKKDRMMQMMASPTPEIFSKLGAILTAVDDAQDAISTIAAVGRIVRKIAPKVLSRLLGGPIGLLLTINDILNLVTTIGSMGTFAGYGKRTKDNLTGSNPWGKKAKVKRWHKLRSWKPTFADVIQAAQTTDQVFGVGISLGPIVGFAQDIFHGMVRQSTGQKVTFKFSPHSVPEWVKLSYRVIKSTAPFLALPWKSPDHDILMLMQAQAMAQEVIMPYQQEWNPFDVVNNIEGSEIHCPIPSHPTTLWAMDELGINVQDVIGWPLLNKAWASPDELTEVYAPLISHGVKKFVTRHNHDGMGALACSLVADSAMYQMANIVGEENVEYDFTVASKLATTLFINKLMPDPRPVHGPYAKNMVILKIKEHERNNDPIPIELFRKYCNMYDYRLIRMPYG